MRFIVLGLQLAGAHGNETPMQAATGSVIGLRHVIGGKGDDECADR
ncbi:hypothetical protein [Azonexus hydrophilus]|jgi:hypothetical protein|uniref:Uncharacterized protein n=1 Tax=Azonexus hydrophilus TaxID=418702 RepID=A0ABZ2XC46_9RHOO|nr:hypothetical protein [Dechloromonas sp.]